MKNIALLKINIATPYDHSVLSLFNKINSQFNDINLNVFTTTYNVNVNNKHFAILPIYEAKYFFGTAVVWDLMSLDLVIGFPNLDKIIYIHDKSIPWRDNSNIPYKVWSRLFDNQKINMLISDKYIADIFKYTWGIGEFVEKLDEKVIYEKI